MFECYSILNLSNDLLLVARNKISYISVDISPKYRISVGTDMILPTDQKIGQKISKITDISAKYRKFSIFQRNIESISHAHMC